MNTLTEHDRKLAETLKSLTLEPSTEITKDGGKPFLWAFCILAIIAIATVAILMLPSTLEGIEARLSATPAPAKLDKTTALLAISKSDKLSPISQPSQPTAREITGSGYVIAPRSTTIFSRYEGTIKSIAVDVGDHVKAGQALVTLDDANARLILEQAKAAKISADLELSAKNIDLTQATASFQRAETLALRNAAPKRELEEAETVWRNAQNAVEQARQNVVRAELTIRLAQEQVNDLHVYAPFAGTVTKLNAHLGDTVLARADSVRENQSLLALTDTTNMVIDADVAETNVALLRPGLRGEAVLDGFPDQPFGIELQRVAPVASAEKGTVGLRLSLINPPVGIRPNMAARIRISVAKPQDQAGDVRP